MAPAARPRVVDANVFLRYFTGDDPDKSEAARALLERVERGVEKVTTDVLVVFETVFTLQRTYKVPKARIREMVGDVLALPGIQLHGKRRCLDALDLYADQNVSFVDAYLAVAMQARGLSEIYSWDREFDRLAGIVRITPSPLHRSPDIEPSRGEGRGADSARGPQDDDR
jgi:predicted nucleic acid-binding protein